MSNNATHVRKQIEQGYELLLSLLRDLQLQLDLCGVPSRECQRNGPLPEWLPGLDAYSDEEYALWILPALSDFYSISDGVYVALKHLHDQDDELFHPGRIAVWPWGIRFSADPHDVKKSLEEFIWNLVSEHERALEGQDGAEEFFAKYPVLESEANRYLTDLRAYVTTVSSLSPPPPTKEAPLLEAMLEVLPTGGIRRAIGPKEIETKLVNKGIAISNTSVRSALLRMVRKGWAERLDRGKYVRAPRDEEQISGTE